MRPFGRKICYIIFPVNDAVRAVTKGERTRQSIIEKAAPVFNRLGYAGTSLSDLMEETGLEKGGIYRHFASKEELAVAAFDYAWAKAKHNRLQALEKFSSPLAKLHGMVDDFADRPSVTPGGCPLLNTAIDSDDGNPVLRAHARAAMRGWLDRIEATLQDGIACGEIKADIDRAAVAALLVTTLEGSVMMSRLMSSRQALEAARRYLKCMLDDIAL
jgi:TetR/AcrR family transcriptional regulator, transcriptional repressor for nem operon